MTVCSKNGHFLCRLTILQQTGCNVNEKSMGGRMAKAGGAIPRQNGWNKVVSSSFRMFFYPAQILILI
jgi:hypothetical protein